MRSLFRFSLGLSLVALLILGVARCSREPSGPAASADDDLVIAKVAGKKFTVGDLKKKLRYQYRSLGELSGPSGAEQLRQVYHDAVDQLAMVAYGEKKGYDKDPEFKDTWELSRRYILAERTVQHEVREKEVPTEEEIRRYYDEHLGEFTIPNRVQIAHVRTATKAEAEAVRARLQRGEPIDEVAKKYSIDEATKLNGGQIGWLTQTGGAGHYGYIPQINVTAMLLKKGEASAPVRIESGWVILYATDRSGPSARPYDETVKETVKKKAQLTKHNALYDALVARLNKDFGVQLFEDRFEEYAMTLLSEEDLFSGAQREKNPARKLGNYQAILRRFPESTHAPQAQFMVGFIQADELKDYPAAREAFKAFLEKFPDDELAASARWMLENMDKPDPDLKGIEQVRRQLKSR